VRPEAKPKLLIFLIIFGQKLSSVLRVLAARNTTNCERQIMTTDNSALPYLVHKNYKTYKPTASTQNLNCKHGTDTDHIT
jgi:hypothetical protein